MSLFVVESEVNYVNVFYSIPFYKKPIPEGNKFGYILL